MLQVAERLIPPRHHVPQDGCTRLLEGSHQFLELGMRLGVEPDLVPGTVAHVSRVRHSW